MKQVSEDRTNERMGVLSLILEPQLMLSLKKSDKVMSQRADLQKCTHFVTREERKNIEDGPFSFLDSSLTG